MTVKQLKRVWDEQRLVQANEVSDDEVFGAIRSIPKHYSANLVVDLGGKCASYPSLLPVQTQSGAMSPLSGVLIGVRVDLMQADTFCNLMVAGQNYNGSGGVQLQVQTSDSDTSGNYTDPTSGLPQFPTWFASGGILWLNSGGLLGGTLQGAVQNAGTASGTPNSGYFIASGYNVFAGFQRVGRYARINLISGSLTSGYAYNGPLVASFVTQLRTTGSGGGFSYAPSSGSVNV